MNEPVPPEEFRLRWKEAFAGEAAEEPTKQPPRPMTLAEFARNIVELNMIPSVAQRMARIESERHEEVVRRRMGLHPRAVEPSPAQVALEQKVRERLFRKDTHAQ